MRILNHLFDGSKIISAFICMKIYRVFNKDKIYLIGERSNQCQDNGYHFFKYVRENSKNDKFYYCITKDSSQLSKINNLGNIIYYKSFKHYLYYLLADKLICSHAGSCTPDTAVIWKMEEKNYIKKNRVFIQHGITKELIPSLMQKNTKFESFICGVKPEYEYVKKYFGYEEKQVKYLGFCRFDALHDFKTKNQILVMPTWRQWFGMDRQNEMSREEFVKSDYFLHYNNLINDKELAEILKKNDMKFIFYPHNEMQRYIDLFKSELSNIEIADGEIYDVQTLLKESKILITDYSSIAFDFAYMKKPVIYYQFDEEEYFNNHYSKGYFDYDRDGFGKVIKTIKSLNQEIQFIIESKNDFRYLSNLEKFFEIDDNLNCQRVYQHIRGDSTDEKECTNS